MPLGALSPLVDATVDLRGLVSDSSDLVLATRGIAEDLMSGFEFIEPWQIDREGRLRTRYFYRDRIAPIEKWASARGVETSDETSN